MGYETDFEGHLSVDPPLTAKEIKEFRKFCSERHGGHDEPYEGMPGFWCDWGISDDGSQISPIEGKNYDTFEWLEQHLIPKFLVGRKLSGKILAQGEDINDRWKIVADNNGVKKVELE